MKLKEPVKNIDFEKRIFAASPVNFGELAIDVFRYQYEQNEVYKQYCDLLHANPDNVDSLKKIPFLPISFFKTHEVKTGLFDAEDIFESSGTTGATTSKHFIKDLDLYKKSFSKGFEKFYGSTTSKCIIGLLPSYLERKHSSLVMMVEELIRTSEHQLSGFYLYDHEKLHRTIMHNEIKKTTTLLIGVTWALLDFAEKYPMQLRHTIVMETGGMKGRREELTRQQVHEILEKQLGLSLIHSEYGMTELLSQAYSKGDGIFHCPPWMKVLLRDEDDPLNVFNVDEDDKQVSGVINIIDLANIHSCSFIATDDMGKLYRNGSFEVLGRVDMSDVRGCSLMVV
ncbi:MAG TPA: hypothetical protein VKH37_02415 [Ferruginibacter sp.]|nr:hypothetical protein [Ferruginibacter sp.]